MNDVLKLPQTLDVAAVRAVQAEMLTRRGKPINIDASDLERIGALGIELLLAAQLQWKSDGQPLKVEGFSDSVRNAFTDLGLDAATLDARETDLKRGTE